VTYLYALRNGVGNRYNAAETTELLPLFKVSNIRAEMALKIGIEELNATQAALLLRPAHVLGQTPELDVEGVGRNRLEALEFVPSVVAMIRIRAAIIARSWSSANTGVVHVISVICLVCRNRGFDSCNSELISPKRSSSTYQERAIYTIR
jgi:hypothetical protein